MAEEAKKKPESAPAAPAAADKGGDKKEAAKGHAAAGGGMLSKTPVLLGGAMLIEAVVLFAGFKFLGAAPNNSAGADLHAEDPAATASEHGGEAEKPAASEHGGAPEKGGAAAKPIDKRKQIELSILNGRFPNKQTGKTFLYDVEMFAVTKGEHKEKVEATILERKALITDRVRTIIAQSDPEKLGGGSEPGLETLRRQVKYQLDDIVGMGIIDEVLVPKCTPFRADY